MAQKWARFFNEVGQSYMAKYLSTFNMATQTFAVDGSNAENVQTSGGAPAMLNGLLIPALAADAELDISADTTAAVSPYSAVNGSGAVITTAYSQYFLALATSAGVLSLWEAGDQQLDAAATCKIPFYDPETYIPIGLLLIDSATYTLGTTSTSGVSTFIQLTGPIFPHYDNIPEIFKY